MSDKTILIHLNKLETLGKLVPYEFTEAHQQSRIEYCVTLFNRQNSEGILNRIDTCD